MALPWPQFIALIILGYVVGMFRLPFLPKRAQQVFQFIKGLAGLWLITSLVTGTFVLHQSPEITQLAQIIVVGFAILLGDNFPLPKLFSKDYPRDTRWLTFIGFGFATILFQGTNNISIFASTTAAFFVLTNGLKKNLTHLLPLIALAPAFFIVSGSEQVGTIMAYILLAVILFFEIIRLVRPSLNRKLQHRAPYLFGVGNISRPVPLTAAITAIAILVLGQVRSDTLIVAAGLGIVMISLSAVLKRVQTKNDELLWRDVTRNYALATLLTTAVLVPGLVAITAIPLGAGISAGLTAAIVALLPLPVDRYLSVPLAVTAVLAIAL